VLSSIYVKLGIYIEKFVQGVFEVEAFLVHEVLYSYIIILKNCSLNLLSKMFLLTEIIDCIFL
jgi:hypothetical protein